MAFARIDLLPLSSDEIGVALTFGGRGAGHVGIVYHSTDGVKKLMHFNGEGPPLFQPVSTISRCYIACRLNLTVLRSQTFVGRLRHFEANPPRYIPYGVNFDKILRNFDDNLFYNPPSDSDGLTCATFVVAFLEALKVKLLLLETWLAEPRNEVFVEDLCRVLETQHSNRFPPERIAKIKANSTGHRIRPEEVAVAADSPNPPITYAQAKAGIPSVWAVLESVCQKPQGFVYR